MPLPALDRWERKQQARGGPVKKRCGRYTKPGVRIRALPASQEKDLQKELEDQLLYKDPHTPLPHLTVEGRPYRLIQQTQEAGHDPVHIVGVGTDYIPRPVNTTSYYEDSTGSGITLRSSGTATWIDSTTSSVTWNPDVTNATLTTAGTGDGYWRWGDNYTVPYVQEAGSGGYAFAPPDPVQVRKDEIRRNIEGGTPRHRTERAADFLTVSGPEIVALQLLKKMLNQDEWKRYLRYGFIIVESQKTGLTYQVIRNNAHVKVYRKGKKVGELCIVVDGKTPPSDKVIALKIMLECTESQVWGEAGIHARDVGLQYHDKPTEDQLIKLAA